MLKDYVAIAATVCVAGSYIPQIIKAHRTKKLDDLAWGFLGIILLGVTLWIWYGILNDDLTFILTNAAILCMSSTLALMKFMYSRR